MWKSFLDLLFPAKCPQCGAYVEEQQLVWCKECFTQLLSLRPLSLDTELEEIFSGGIWALGNYEESLERGLKEFKYGKRALWQGGLCNLVSKGLEQIETPLDLVVPVPLHESKERERGFNQAVELFQAPFLARGVPMAKVLLRQKKTLPQYGLGKKERRGNIKEAFSTKEGYNLQEKRVVLVDDIMTTGATMRACGRLLQKEGPSLLMGLVVATGRL